MKFDPSTYGLETTGGFDPSTYGVEESPEWLTKRGAKPGAKGEKHSLDDQLAEIRALTAKGMKGSGTDVFMNHLANSATLGGAGWLAGKLAPGAEVDAAVASDDQAHPYAALGGELTGAMLPGAGPARIAKGLGKGVKAVTGAVGDAARAVIPGAESALARYGGKVLQAGAEGAATGAVTSGARAAVEGDDLGTIADKAGDAAKIGGAMGGALSAVAQPLGAAGRAIRNRNADVQLMKQYGAEPTVTSPGKGKVFEEGRVAEGLTNGRTTDSGIGRVSRMSARDVRKGLNKEADDLGTAHEAMETGARDAGLLADKHDVTDFYNEARDIYRNSTKYKADVRARINEEILKPMRRQHKNKATERFEMSTDDVNAFRKKIDDVADFDTPTGKVKDATIAGIGEKFRSLLDDTPFGPINDKFHEGAEKLRESHRALNVQGKNRMRTDEHEMSAEKTLTDTITRRGQNTVTAGKYETPELDELVQRRPDLALPLDSAALLRARGRMQFLGGGDFGGLIDRARHPIAAAAQAVDPIAVRLVSPLLQGAEANAAAPNALIEGLRREQELRRKRASKLRGQSVE